MLIRSVIRFFLCLLVLFSQTAHARQISFDLMDHNGAVTHQSYPGKYKLLSIGYTTCPDICPTTLYEYALTMQALEKPDNIVPIFVTIDPVNDDAATLHAYTQYFDNRIVGLTGTMENIRALTDQLGATFGYRAEGKRVDNPVKGASYTVYHSSLIYLIDPNNQLLDVFDYQMGADDLAEALNKVL